MAHSKQEQSQVLETKRQRQKAAAARWQGAGRTSGSLFQMGWRMAQANGHFLITTLKLGRAAEEQASVPLGCLCDNHNHNGGEGGGNRGLGLHPLPPLPLVLCQQGHPYSVSVIHFLTRKAKNSQHLPFISVPTTYTAQGGTVLEQVNECKGQLIGTFSTLGLIF